MPEFFNWVVHDRQLDRRVFLINLFAIWILGARLVVDQMKSSDPC